ncbi:hypothetical protein DDJ70_15550 [Klebsiella michiganensis]|uniref:hypothetical protein n=1 Tax=Klebsiella michiganensis TaxID=1134687 RepID=UPI000E2A3D78|nr:hypothetical protein [Klebsiella michiganensis]RFC07280.1 hypothetical protein DDJ70_15550 [Klebsiella michiganensis]
MIGIFKYAAKKDMVLGISDQQAGAKAVILPTSSPLNKILWSVDDRTGEIVLAASEELLLGICGDRMGSGAAIELQVRGNKATQQWVFVPMDMLTANSPE